MARVFGFMIGVTAGCDFSRSANPISRIRILIYGMARRSLAAVRLPFFAVGEQA